MKIFFKTFCAVSAALMITACKAETPVSYDLSGEKPELKILTMYQSYNMESQPSFETVREMTGYNIKYYMLPADNAELKLFLEIAGGIDYDLIYRLDTKLYAHLAAKNALMDIEPLLEEYGGTILETVGSSAWSTVTSDQGISGIPHESPVPTQEEPYGSISGGIGIRSDVLEEMDRDIPKTLPEFTDFLREAKKKYGVAPLAASKSSVFSYPIMAAFGMAEPAYYDIDGAYIPRVKHPGLPDYLAYLQMLYKEGLMDNDMPVSTNDNAMEKFANKAAVAIMPMMFWNIPSALNALQLNNPDCKVLFATNLAANDSTKPIAYISEGVDFVSCIPKTAKNPAHAINWINIISNAENFKKIYIGEENVSYEIIDGKYYPVFPAFNDYANADKFTGVADPATAHEYWQARARKTPEMADAYDQMNNRLGEYEILDSVEHFGFNQPSQDLRQSLEQAFNDAMLKAIVSGTDPEEAVNHMREEWDKNGGTDVDREMSQWYAGFVK